MERNGGTIIAERLKAQGVEQLFTLCGGHISPILVGARQAGIAVVDVRDEVTSVFAADAVSRLTGVPGVAAVTAGPGVTNTVTAIKNAQMAQSPLVLFGGATPTVLMGRGSLQDIDQMELMRPLVKWCTSVRTVNALGPTVDKAFEIARSGVPGPVFVEVPVDVLYHESLVKEWFAKESGVENATGIGASALKMYLKAHLARQFHAPHLDVDVPRPDLSGAARILSGDPVARAARALEQAERPALVVGSQALVNYTPEQAEELAAAISQLGIPVWLGGNARGLLGRFSDIQYRHKRSAALREADVVVVAGFPFDFRLTYGRAINSRATLVSANLSLRDLTKNRLPEIPALEHPGDFLQQLAARFSGRGRWAGWRETLQGREDARDEEIVAMAAGTAEDEKVNPMAFFLKLEEKMSDDSVLVVDGGDFVATGAYILRPRGALRWLDPGVFGTLGVGGGFAVGAALARPTSEVWLIYGDGSSAYSLAEFDTCVRHGLAPIAVIGTDASWGQIARDQVEILGSDCGTALLPTAYHRVAEGYGGEGILVERMSEVDAALDRAIALQREGKPVCINLHLAPSDFRKGSISM